MLRITREERKRLEEVGLWKERKFGSQIREANFVIVNKTHLSRSKTYYIVEEPAVMRRLEKWDKANVVKITEEQFNTLKEKKIVTDRNIQTYDKFNFKAFCFIARNGDIYITKKGEAYQTLFGAEE